jgi:hypothetical protein
MKNKLHEGVWTELIWPKLGMSGILQMQGNSSLAENLSESEDGRSCMELVCFRFPERICIGRCRKRIFIETTGI